MSSCPTVDLPAHFNERERLLRHIPTGYAKPSLEILRKVVCAVGKHWPNQCSDEINALCCANRSHIYCDRSPSSGKLSNIISKSEDDNESEPSTPRTCDTDTASSTPRTPEILISMALGSSWNELYVTSVHNALEFLFKIGFRYDAEKNEMIFCSVSHLKEQEEQKNHDLPRPCYLDFDAKVYLREIDEAIDWHRRRMVLLSKKLKSHQDIKVLKPSIPAKVSALCRRGDDNINMLTPIDEDEIDEDLKCALNVCLDKLLNEKLSIVRDDRTRHDISRLACENKVHMNRVQKSHDRMQNY